MRYRYSVSGRSYESTEIGTGGSPDFADEEEGRLFLERHPVGSRMRIYHDPANPPDAVMIRGLPGGWLASAAFAITWLLFCLGFVAILLLSSGGHAGLDRIEWLASGPYRSADP